MPIPMTEDRKREFCLLSVTLNGLPACIGGYKNDFASVVQLDTGLRAEFAWQTVEHVVNNNGGNFRA